MRKVQAFWPNWVIAAGLVLVLSSPSQAFYWYGWPSNPPPTRVIVGPPGSEPGKPGSPPRVPVGLPGNEPGSPPTGPTGPGQPSGPPGPGTNTPEPATGIAAIVGLGLLASARLARRRSLGRVDA